MALRMRICMCVCVCTIVRACILAQRRNAAGFLGGLNTLLHRVAMEGQAASACAAPSGSEADRGTDHRHTGVPAGFVLPGELPDDNTAKVLKQNQALLKLVEGLSDRVMRLESREQGKGPKAGPKWGLLQVRGRQLRIGLSGERPPTERATDEEQVTLAKSAQEQVTLAKSAHKFLPLVRLHGNRAGRDGTEAARGEKRVA